jgi:HK97 gp10 family phage protein
MTRSTKINLFKRDSVSSNFAADIKAQLAQFVDKVNADVLPVAMYAGTKILYDEMKINAPKGTPRSTGRLADAIYHFRVEKGTPKDQQIWHIGVNKRKAPHWHWLEYGNSQIPAQSYIRKTSASKMTVAINASLAKFAEKMKEVSNA